MLIFPGFAAETLREKPDNKSSAQGRPPIAPRVASTAGSGRVIDFSSILDGPGDDRGCQIALDGAGNIYIAGLTNSPDFETTPGALLSAAQSGEYQVFLRKLSPDGSRILYSTLLGSSPLQSAHPLGLRVDQAGNAWVAIYSPTPALPGVTPVDAGGRVAVYRISPNGDQLLYGARILPGANYVDPIALAIDKSGNAFVAAGNSTVRVEKIDASGSNSLLSFQVSVGLSSRGVADIAVGPDGSIYLAGTTEGGGLKTTNGAFEQTVGNVSGKHGYLIRMKPDGSGPLYSTYIGGQFVDVVSALAVDASGAVLVGG